MSLIDSVAIPEPDSLGGLVPLVLHRIVPEGTPVQEWEDVHEALLERIVGHIGRRAASFCGGEPRGDSRWLITFDDGYSSDYTLVFPKLLDAGITATFFLVADWVGRPGYLSWQQVEEMHRHGMCFGSHGLSHRQLTELSSEEITTELMVSRQVLEERIGAPVRLFSFPFGATNSRLHEQGFVAGYEYLCTSGHGVVGRGRVIPRNSINSAMDWTAISRILEPDLRTRSRWFIEDVVKGGAKRIVGDDLYRKIRNRVLRAR